MMIASPSIILAMTSSSLRRKRSWRPSIPTPLQQPAALVSCSPQEVEPASSVVNYTEALLGHLARASSRRGGRSQGAARQPVQIVVLGVEDRALRRAG